MEISVNNDERPSPDPSPGATPLTASTHRLGWLAAAAVVALRLMIGLHFFLEGTGKLADPKPFSGPFFSNAKGPLAGIYKGLVWDPDGLHRLDREATINYWDNYRNRIVAHYGFADKQKKEADAALKTISERYKYHLDAKEDVISEYRLMLARRDANAEDESRQLASLQTHDSRIAGETRKLYGEIVPPIDKLWRDLETDLNHIATAEQWKPRGRLKIGRIGRSTLGAETMDAIVPYFNLAVGVLLLLGLFTRPAAIAGAVFLASVCASQWPGTPGAAPIFNQAVEMFALLTLAAIGAGRYFGLDFFLGSICCRRKPTGETK
jgi:uncharacterized membrane protein YphA (DoxX/SURF4 family)